jgi:hypothetical protein
MTIRNALAVVSISLIAGCQDAPPPTSAAYVLPIRTASIENSILGPTLLALGQTGNYSVSTCPSGSNFHWQLPPDMNLQPSGVCSMSWASSHSFQLNFVHIMGELGAGLWIDVWQDCDPRVGASNPAYCDAEILGDTDADRYEQCVWQVDTNMPIELTVVTWRVNGVLQHTGPEFAYAHSSYGSFVLYMEANTPNFGSRNDTDTITVGQGLTCLQ